MDVGFLEILGSNKVDGWVQSGWTGWFASAYVQAFACEYDMCCLGYVEEIICK